MRVFAVLSGKGGVGKTTTVANLGAALAVQGSRVVAVDMNWTTPNLGYHLGIDAPPVPLEEVAAGRRSVADALLALSPRLGCLLPTPGLPGEISRDSITALFRGLRAIEADVALLDCPPGLEPVKSLLPHADGALVVTNPELPAMADALITVRYAREARPVWMELNRARWGRPGPREVARLCGAPVVAVVPESGTVTRSVERGRPAVAAHPWSRPSRAFLRMAGSLAAGFPGGRRGANGRAARAPLAERLDSLHRRMAEVSAHRPGEVSRLLASIEDYRSRGLLSEEAYRELRRVNLARLQELGEA